MQMSGRTDKRRALDYLARALPPADLMLPGMDEMMERVAEHALSVRKQAPWGDAIPEDIFLAFVLFPRVNDEDPAFYHDAIWASLGPRLAGKDMARAALEVNRWCCENAAYQSTDDRTANALTVLRRGFGRCGEESVLLVSALRACALPARQIYAPLWSHCDDNHAWVEVWVDGGWHYMGACEPELSLDSGWFTAAASKAMLTRTRAWGLLPAQERCEGMDGGAYIINRTAAYAKTALLTLRVTENGAPKPGLRVDFELANMAAYAPICQKTTDGDGRVDLLTGLGTLHLYLTDGERALEATVDVADRTDYTLNFAGARPFSPGSARFEQRPPRESRMQSADGSKAEAKAHARWLAGAAAARERRFALPAGTDAVLRRARGNRAEVEIFLSDARFDAADARALVDGLRDKDLGDATADMLRDALEGALPWRERWPRKVWAEGVLCPRVADEPLRPFRRWARAALPGFEDAREVWRYILARVRAEDMRPRGLTPDSRAALEQGVSTPLGRDILFVALCRVNGIPARLDPVTGEKQYYAGGAYRPLSGEAPARLRLLNRSGRTLTGGVHFSVSALEGGAFRKLSLYGVQLKDALDVALPAGRYRVMTAARQIDGSLEGNVTCVGLASGEAREVALALPEDRTGDVLLRAALSPLCAWAADGGAISLPEAAREHPAIVAVIAPGQEPTEHFLNELMENREALRKREIGLWLLVGDWPDAENDKLKRVLSELEDAKCLARPDAAALVRWREIMNAGELRLPLAVAVDEAGRGLFAFVNYNVGSVETLIRVIDAR